MLSLRRLSSAFSHKCISPIASERHLSTTRQPLPWFVDPEPDPIPQSFIERVPPPHLRHDAPPPVPHDAPQPLKELHAQLSQSPHLDQAKLLVARPSAIPEGPPLPELPERQAQGRRKRGRTYAGEGIPMPGGGIWSWLLLAQVKEGTEDRGAIESVVRTVRKSLLTMRPPLPIPPNLKRRNHNGWAMIDAGNFAIHILSKEAREKYFFER